MDPSVCAMSPSNIVDHRIILVQELWTIGAELQPSFFRLQRSNFWRHSACADFSASRNGDHRLNMSVWIIWFFSSYILHVRNCWICWWEPGCWLFTDMDSTSRLSGPSSIGSSGEDRLGSGCAPWAPWAPSAFSVESISLSFCTISSGSRNVAGSVARGERRRLAPKMPEVNWFLWGKAGDAPAKAPRDRLRLPSRMNKWPYNFLQPYPEFPSSGHVCWPWWCQKSGWRALSQTNAPSKAAANSMIVWPCMASQSQLNTISRISRPSKTAWFACDVHFDSHDKLASKLVTSIPSKGIILVTTDPQPIEIQVSWRSFTSEDLTVEQLLDIFFVHLTVPSRLDVFVPARADQSWKFCQLPDQGAVQNDQRTILIASCWAAHPLPFEVWLGQQHHFAPVWPGARQNHC